ncbi:MAG: gluconokinase [Vreelandella alkaliphila]|uniref:Gluconokinase n=1 Tax=Halomonas campaniensis TaxID=213554 RepID=A0A3D0KJA6_9GAMM|nr:MULTISPECIES: gluconokinase [unclassified Halomonas]HBP40401.1 gluconokinase [Halomonas sp.]HBS84202.1 gluconokinase [Halomonas campaniensis]ASK19511.1 gluconate kinase [Halomonas sp. N3-2A]UTD53994.1 gluconokinase [Halomonas sp. MS1]HCA03647.1 gluconokinase [Halomonas campaniensis]
MNKPSHRILVMGVSGSGKSHIGQQLAAALGATFIDGDDHHSPANVAKMASGTPLNDNDRRDWLATLADLFAAHKARNASVVIACSGLKKRYRDRLREGDPALHVLYLEGSHALLRERLATRAGHFFKGDNMLASQLADLEPPSSDEAMTVSIALSPSEIVEHFTAALAPTLRVH